MTTIVNGPNGKQYVFNISFDKFGNMYLENNEFSGSYQVNIDGKNVPYTVNDTFKIIQKNVSKIGKIKLLDNHRSLKDKVHTELEENRLKLDDFNINDNDLLNEPDYFPEDNDHINIIDEDEDDDNTQCYKEIFDEDNVNKYGIDNLEFLFWGYNDISVNYREDGDISSLYDTYVYGKGNTLIFKSNSKDENSIFRLMVYQNGDIHFRPISENAKIYHMSINDKNELIFY